MPHSWIFRWYFRIHSGDGELFQPNKFGCYQLPKQVFHIQCNGCFNCRCSHGAQQHGVTGMLRSLISPLLILQFSILIPVGACRIVRYFRIYSGDGLRFQPNKFGSTNSPKQFSISNVTAVSTAVVAMERSNMAPRACFAP